MECLCWWIEYFVGNELFFGICDMSVGDYFEWFGYG